MNAKMRAFEDLKQFSARYRGVFDLLEELADVGSIEQAGDEAAQRLAALRAEQERTAVDTEKMVADAHAQVEAVRREGAAVGDAAVNRAKQIEHDAHKAAAAHLAVAEEQAEKMLGDAQDNARKVREGVAIMAEEARSESRATAARIVAEAVASVDSLSGEILYKTQERDGLVAQVLTLTPQVAELQARHDDLAARLSDIRSRFVL